MILCLGNNPEIFNEGYAPCYSTDNRTTFGIPYCYLDGHDYPKLARSEDLFITAHGNADEMGNAVGNPSYSPEQVATIARSMMPGGWEGSVYLSACDSGRMFAARVLAALGASFNGRVYGVSGPTPLAIQAPNHTSWRAAT